MTDKEGKLTLHALVSYLHKKVEIKLTDGSVQSGCVFTIDPESLSIVLIESKESKCQANIVMYHAVDEISILSDEECLRLVEEFDRLVSARSSGGQQHRYDNQAIEQRKLRLTDWLKKSRIPFQWNGDRLQILEVVTVIQPYDDYSCSSSNAMALGRVKKLIQSVFRDNITME